MADVYAQGDDLVALPSVKDRPKVGSDEESRLQAIDRQIADLHGVDPYSFTNASEVRDLASRYGGSTDTFKPYLDFGKTPIAGGQYDAIYGVDQTSGALKNRAGVAEVLQGLKLRRLQELQKERSNAAQDVLKRKVEDAKSEEQVLREKVLGLRSDLTSAIDKQLTALLEETGINAANIFQDTAGALASRGMLRSTAANRAFNEITLNQQQEQARLRGAAESNQYKVQRGIDKTIGDIDQRRKEIEFKQMAGEALALDDMSFNIDVENLKTQFQNEIADAQLSARDQSFFYQMIGGTIGNLGRIFAGS